jgi:hypothetical protein
MAFSSSIRSAFLHSSPPFPTFMVGSFLLQSPHAPTHHPCCMHLEPSCYPIYFCVQSGRLGGGKKRGATVPADDGAVGKRIRHIAALETKRTLEGTPHPARRLPRASACTSMLVVFHFACVCWGLGVSVTAVWGTRLVACSDSGAGRGNISSWGGHCPCASTHTRPHGCRPGSPATGTCCT